MDRKCAFKGRKPLVSGVHFLYSKNTETFLFGKNLSMMWTVWHCASSLI